MEGRVPGAPPGGRRVGGRAVVVSLLAFVALLATPAAVAVNSGWSTFPLDQLVEATSSSGAVVTWTDPTTVDPGLDVVHARRSRVPRSRLAMSTVTCTATDTSSAVPVTFSDELYRDRAGHDAADGHRARQHDDAGDRPVRRRGRRSRSPPRTPSTRARRVVVRAAVGQHVPDRDDDRSPAPRPTRTATQARRPSRSRSRTRRRRS